MLEANTDKARTGDDPYPDSTIQVTFTSILDAKRPEKSSSGIHEGNGQTPVEFKTLQYPVTFARIVYCLATFVGSALLFLIQPMAAKILLPTFGGSPAVWTSAMLFFQVALLGGYAYAHFSNHKLQPYRQRFVHIAVLAAAAIALPFTTKFSPINEAGFPPAQVFFLLATTVGLSYFAVSAGSPVLQRWFATTNDSSAKDPYFLYAVSNFGSMLGLFAYPFFVEPRFKLADQANIWRYGFLALLALFAVCALFAKPAPVEAKVSIGKIALSRKLRWLLIAALPSSLLLGATNNLSSNIAPIPLIWVVPLAAYLLSFILAFASKPVLNSGHLARILPLVMTPLAFTICIEATEPLALLATFHIVVFTIAAWMCHALLAEDRPSAENLTEFYLWLSLGGAIGGLFNSIIAPVIFRTFFEYPLALCLICLLRPATKEFSNQSRVLLGVAVFIFVSMLIIKNSGLPPGNLRAGIAIGIPLILVFSLVERTKVYALGMLAIFGATLLVQIASPGKVVLTRRSFFGVHRVLDGDRYRSLVHGNTTHGRQSLDPAKENLPLTYYYPTGPVGMLFSSPQLMSQVRKVGLVGLGVGSLAAYGQPGQQFSYFEIDPEVLFIARDSGLFTFLKNGKAQMRYVLGDARLTLANEPNDSFDMLVLDAFSSDAIPTHLLTAEAIQMYERKLAPGGVIAFHVSNRYLELAPLLALTARKAGLQAFENLDGSTADEEQEGKTQSNWVLLTRDRGVLQQIRRGIDWSDVDIPLDLKPWSDDYVNLLQVFKPSE